MLDLGSGTGSTARAFGDVAGAWRFVDGDAALLDMAQARHPGAECIVMNLRDVEGLPMDDVTLVTASALLDLMPVGWMQRLARLLATAAVPFYAALNYDGVMEWSPESARDAGITAAFNVHQQTDKGIGPAMGPQSGAMAAQVLAEHGFDVITAPSPWRLGPDHAELHRQLIAGIAEAAGQTGTAQAWDWAKERWAAITQSHAVIGHTDLLAIPRGQV